MIFKSRRKSMEIRHFTVLALLSALLVACAEEEKSGYIFTCPRSFKIGSTNELQLLRFGNLDAGDVNVRLYNSQNENETLVSEKTFQLAEGIKETLLKFPVKPFLSYYVYSGRIEINGTIGKEIIGGSDKIYFSTPKNKIIVIQTDKPLYKPGQEVRFRILKIDQHLRPSLKNDDVAEAFVEDPRETRLFQFSKIHLGKGLNELQFPLANEPVLGSWKITVNTGSDTESTTFDVKEYVLPKFEVKIKFPSYVLANEKSVPVEVCAQYTYGKPVIGHLNLNLSLEMQYAYNYDKLPVLQESVELKGCYNYSLNISLIQPDSSYNYRRIMVVANVIEAGTGVQINATEYLQRQSSPLNLNFNADQDQRNYFKPGLPYNGKLKVTNPDNTPAEGEPIEICYTVSRQRVIYNWSATKTVKSCKNYTSDAEGIIMYTIPPQNVDTTSLQLLAKSIRYENHPNGPDKILTQPESTSSLSPFFSPSGSSIQLENIGDPIPCGTKKIIRLLFTSKKNNVFKFYYEILRQGKVVQFGTKKVTFTVKDDVSKEFENDNQLINGSVEQTFPSPVNLSSSSSEDDCSAAKDSLYVPLIGKTEFKINVESDLSPSFTLLVFYVRDDKETVADSHKFEVEKCFKNKVDFKFSDTVKQPGQNTTVKVTTSPNSLCGLKIVDKSVTLIDNSDQLTKDKIFQLIENMDTGIYTKTNPCNNNAPQPGLYQSSLIIPKPGTYSTSSYEDSYASFQDSGFVVISNLILFTRPCSSNGGGCGERIYYGGFAIKALVVPNSENALITTKSAVDVRQNFPETWLFELEMTGPDGVYLSNETLPGTITEWIGNAVCVSPKDGLGISNTSSIRGFQLFFISYTLPISAIRGEEFYIVVSIFSYADGALPIKVSLDKPEGFEVISDSINEDICIKPGTSESFRVKLKATTVGKINITVRAETAKSSKVCGNLTVSKSVARDAIMKSLNIEAEGFPVDEVQSILVCPKDEKNHSFEVTHRLILPKDVVNDSARAYIDVTGNIMGPAIQNLNNLVTLPTGCGEQNMVKFTPNYLVLDYLSYIGQLTDVIKYRAIRNLNTGYQTELTYRHRDGSFSAFGELDKSGSMFLTAFVLRSFYQAQRYITIDNSILTSAQNWIVSKQQSDGCFPDIGKIIVSNIQGALEKDKNPIAITAYVLASLLISKYENQTVIDSVKTCLNKSSISTPYETFLVAYAKALGGDIDAAKKLLKEIKPYAQTKDGAEFYNNPNGTRAVNIETAAYKVLANLKVGNGPSSVLALVRYLIQNMKATGGFYSTQDTIVGLEALSEFAKLVYKDPVNIEVSIKGGLDIKVKITQENKLLVQRNKVSKVPSDLNIKATGSGCGLIQTSLRYNSKTPPKQTNFYLKVVGECVSAECKLRKIVGIVSYTPEGKKAGMSVVQIKMITGNVPIKESLSQLTSRNKNILRADVEDNEVILYFWEITNTQETFEFQVEEVIVMVKAQAGTAKVFDYYAPENSATTTYSFENSNSSTTAQSG